MANLTSTLTVRLIDNVSGPAGAASRALLGLGTAATAANTRVNFGGIAGLGTALGTASGSVNRFTTSIANRFAQMGLAIYTESERIRHAASRMNAITWPAWFLGAAAGQQVLSFDRIGNTIQAVSDITRQQRQELERYAQQLNAVFPFTNTQVMQSALELSRAGFTFAQTMGALRGTLNLALAGQLEVSQAADIATNILTAMRLPMRTTEQASASMTRIIDTLSYAANQSAISVRDLGDTFRYVGPMAAAAGLSIEQVATAAMVMGNNGIRASEAGVALRSMLVRMARPTREMSATMERLGININDFVRPGRQITANDVIAYLGSSVSNPQQYTEQINAALNDPTLRGSLSGLTRRIVDIIARGGGSVVDRQAIEGDVTAALTASGSHIDLFGFVRRLRELGVGVAEISRLFDVRQGARLITLGVGAESMDQILERFMQRAPGSGQRMADTINQGLPRAWGEFTASIENLILRIADSGIRDRVISILDGLTSMITALANVNPKILEFATVLGAIAAASGGIMIAVSAIGRLVGLITTAGAALAGASLTGAGAGTGLGTGLGTAAAAGVGAGAVAAARATFMRRLMGSLGVAGVGLMGLDIFDREGNLWGFTESIDRYMGWNPRNIFGPRSMTVEDFALRFGLSGPPQPPPGTGPQAGSLTGGSVPPPGRLPSVAEMLQGLPTAAQGAGQDVGSAIAAGVEQRLGAILPQVLRRALEEAAQGLTFSPTIHVTPRIDMGGLNGIHADVGPSVTR